MPASTSSVAPVAPTRCRSRPTTRGPAVESELHSLTATPDSAVENKQSLLDLRGAFHGLSENHHKVIVMRELEGLSYTQIGERLGMTRPVVESTLFRARRRLSKEYDELVSGRRCEHVQMVIDTTEHRELLKLGIRERRQVARHLSHCQPCRRHARMAGVDDSFFQTPGLIGKIAALLPIPWLRGRRAGADQGSALASSSHSSFALQSLQTVARLVDPGQSLGFGRLAAAAAAIALAGMGGGVVAVTGFGAGQSSAGTPLTHPAHRLSTPGTAHIAAASRRSASFSARSSSAHGRQTSARRVPSSGSRSSAATGVANRGGPTGSSSGPQAGQAVSGTPAAGAAPAAGSPSVSGVQLPQAPSLPTTPSLPSIPSLTKPGLPKLGPVGPTPIDPSSLLSRVTKSVPSQLPGLPHVSAPTSLNLPQAPTVPVPDPTHLLAH